MAHCDTYREQLANTYPLFGLALWEPTFVDLGDVGYIRQGKFHRLFNALLPADHPSHHGIPLPEHHEPLTPDVPDHIDRGTLKPDHYCSIGVTVEAEGEDFRATRPPDFPQVSFFCTRTRGGAVLSILVDAQRQDTRARGNFGKWMISHIDSWFAFARRLGLGIERMEEIVLVTGLHLTRSWANVAFFEGQANGQASLGVNVTHGPDISIHWQCLPGSVRGGVRSWGPEGKNLLENQCIFIRGFRVTRVLGILRRQLRGAAGPNPTLDLEPDDDEPDTALTSISNAEMDGDLLQMLFEYVVEQAPDHDMVLVHDDDLARIGECHPDKQRILQRDTLMAHLRTSLPEIQILCDFPSNTGSDLKTGTENTKVAMFAKEFQEWSLAQRRPSTVITSHNIDSSHLSGPSASALRTSLEGSRLAKGPTVRLARVASINPTVLQRIVANKQDHDNAVLTVKLASNNAVHIMTNFDTSSTEFSLLVGLRKRLIGAGMSLWRGNFQSLRPVIGRMLINVDISTGAMYRPGKLIDLALEFLGNPGTPFSLAPRDGLSDHERLRLQQFISGIDTTMLHRAQDPDRRRLPKKLTRESARDLTFQIGDGETMVVAEYIKDQLDVSLRFPDLICVELSNGAITFKSCEVPPGQLVSQYISPDKIGSTLELPMTHPRNRAEKIHHDLSVLQHGQSDYVRQFFKTSRYLEGVVDTNDRIVKAVKASASKNYLASEQANARWDKVTLKLFDNLTYKPAKVPNWVLLIYENRQRFNQQVASQMIMKLVKGCEAVGINIKPQPALVRWESGQGNIGRQLHAASKECYWISKVPPTLIVVILPTGGDDIYTAIKHFSDVSAGITTLCMKSAKCCRSSAQYYANIAIKINAKLGKPNVILEPQDISFLNDPTNPTIVMAADITHPPPGSRGCPSTTSLVGSIDGSGAKYLSKIGKQVRPQGLIQDMKDMCAHIFGQYRAAMSKLPKRILFYRNGVSEREFMAIIEEELPLIRGACAKLGFNPTITLIIVGKEHKIVLPTSESNTDRENCPAKTIVDTTRRVVSPIEFDYYLFDPAGLPGMGKATYYNVLIDENKFTPDALQSLSSALCHVYASPPPVPIPAPVYYARDVCTRAMNDFDRQHDHGYLYPAPKKTTYPTEDENTTNRQDKFWRDFHQTHEHESLGKVMYFT